jgi:hypothetical protein
MGTHNNETTSTAPTYPDAYPVDQHLVIDKTEWVPGPNPEPHLGHDRQRAHRESYYRCIKCGEERQAKRDFPEECDAVRAGNR